MRSEVVISREDQYLLSNLYYAYNDAFCQLRDKYLADLRSEGYGYYDAIRLAKLKVLAELTEIDQGIQEELGTPKCPICGKRFQYMFSHVDKIHHLKWDEFCDTFNWTAGKAYFTPDHCKSLSDQKIHFYHETEEGLRQRREDLHNKYSGAGNPACRSDVRIKISQSRKAMKGKIKRSIRQRNSEVSSRVMQTNPHAYSWGYKFHVLIDNREVIFKSKAEYFLHLVLEHYHIPYKYEPYHIKYFDPDVGYFRSYLVDFEISGGLYEAKSDDYGFDDIKYTYVESELRKQGKILHHVIPSNVMEVLQIDPKERLPESFFYQQIVENVQSGRCKMIIPRSKGKRYYTSSLSFLKKLGENPQEVIERGAEIYEDTKCQRGIK